jgi:cysteine desulfurase
MDNVYYLDANATTFMPDSVLSSMVKWANKGNPSSFYAKDCQQLISNFKDLIINDNNLHNHTVIFTSGASESNSHIITSSVRSFMRKTKYLPHIIISTVEHKSIILCCEQLKNDGLCEYTKINVRTDPTFFGTIDPIELEKNIKPNTCLISIMTANNETGIVNDIPALAAIAHKHKIPFHTDCTQSFGKFGVYNEVDACSISFHKLYGPPGIGLLIIKNNFLKGYDIKALISGTQNNFLRGGTENMPGIGAAYNAYKYNITGRYEKNQYLLTMKQLFKKVLNKYVPCFYLDEFEKEKNEKNKIFWITNRNDKIVLPNTIMFTVYKDHFCNIKMREELEKKGVIVGIGSACNTVTNKLSDVVTSLDIPSELRSGILRISFADDVTKKHISQFITHFLNLLNELYSEQ